MKSKQNVYNVQLGDGMTANGTTIQRSTNDVDVRNRLSYTNLSAKKCINC